MNKQPHGIIYVTGIAGTGKSSARAELDRRGYEAYDVDEGFAGFFHIETGERSMGYPIATRTPEWRRQIDWIFMEEPLRKLQKEAQSRSLFLCGTTWDEKNHWDVFEKVFALVLDNDTLEHRLRTRTIEDAWGRSPHELAEVLSLNEAQNEGYRQLGAHIIDATKPLGEVVDEILAAVPQQVIS